MSVQTINPHELATPESYSHVAIAHGSRLVFVAGQVADDGEGRLVGGGDIAAQARQAFANVHRCLSAAGASPGDVAKLTIYVVGHRHEYLAEISAARISLFGAHRPADVIVGVETLAEPGYLIEVEAIAVVE